MRRHLSARGRLTVLYSSLFALGGGALVTTTYLLVRHTLHSAAPPAISSSVEQTIARCVAAVQRRSDSSAIRKCGELYVNGVRAGTDAQRNTTLAHLLSYSLLGLSVCTVLGVAASWIVAGRILRPVHRLTAAARAANERDLSHRLALQGPRDELRELADTFDAMLDRLERAFTSQRQFIANASHELRTPLTVMRTAIDVLLAKPAPTPEEMQSTGVEVQQAIDHAQRLIEALLLLARNESGRTMTNAVDLATVVEDALDARSDDGVTITTELEEAPATGDAVLLERLIGNLLDNATRYNITAGTVRVATGAGDGQDESHVRVVNTGPVVPADQVERLFLPFTRLDDRTRHDGFGLGLALVRSITAVHGGTILAESNPSGGLDITIRLPRRPTDAATPDERPRPSERT